MIHDLGYPTNNDSLMHAYQSRFVDYCLQRGALKFGEFKLKSGRVSPYFFNAGIFNCGSDLAALAEFYADAIQHSETDFDLLFGPAYKGIPLAAITASALFQQYQKDIPYAFNRKEAKDHGEGGNTVGAEITGRVMIIDDVITAGTAIRESIALIEALGAEVCAVMIALDRQEKGQGELSAIQELEQQGLRVVSIIKLDHILEFLQASKDTEHQATIEAYRAQYGIE